MSEKVVWYAGNSPGEFNAIHRGWILIVQRQQHSVPEWWQWSIWRGGVVKESVAHDLGEAERAAIAAVDRMAESVMSQRFVVDTDVLQEDEFGEWQWSRCVDRVNNLQGHVDDLLQGMRDGAWRAFRVVRMEPYVWK